MDRLEGTGLQKEEEKEFIVTVKIPKENPIEVIKAFPQRTHHPLYLNSDIPDAKIGMSYSLKEEMFKGKELFKTKEKFFFFAPNTLLKAHSKIRFVTSKIWGHCFKEGKKIFAQNCSLIEFKKLLFTDLHPQTATYLLLKRTDLNKDEIANCRECIKKEEYFLYTYMLLNKKFDFDFYMLLKTPKIINNVISEIKAGIIVLDKTDFLIEKITELQTKATDEQKLNQKWVNLILLKETLLLHPKEKAISPGGEGGVICPV